MAWFDRNPGGKKGAEEEHHPITESQPPSVPVAPVASPSTPVAPAAPESPPPVVIHEAPRPVEPGLVASLHKGSRVTGQLTFQGPAMIEGTVEGEIQCHGKLTIGEGAEVRAKINGQVVVIKGRVEGNVTAAERIELVSPARVYGNVITPRLVVNEGVVFDGDCSMGVAKEKAVPASVPSTNVDKIVVAKPPK